MLGSKDLTTIATQKNKQTLDKHGIIVKKER